MLVLGVDGGATKTVCAIANENFDLEGLGIAGPINYHIVGVERARKNLKMAVVRASSNLDGGSAPFDIGCFGIGGLSTQHDYRIISKSIIPSTIAKKRIIVNDVIVAFYAATNGDPGIVIVAGTGSIAYGANKEGLNCFCGGWGWLIGDEGSAFYIARKALNLATKAYDGRSEYTVLIDMFKKRLKLKNFKDIISKIYHQTEPNEIASLATIVSLAAENGDKVARDILEESGRELALAVKSVAKKLSMERESLIVGAVGSVFKSNIVWNAFKQNILTYMPYATLISPIFYPVVGALIMGYKNLGISIDANDKAKLIKAIESKYKPKNSEKVEF
jgi:N-acetylglucosamine kinase-like BadF-type ATPase